MNTFKDDERGYRQWLRLHPTGFVLNLRAPAAAQVPEAASRHLLGD